MTARWLEQVFAGMTIEQWDRAWAEFPDLRAHVRKWLVKNPVPADWQESDDRYAYTEMPLFDFWDLL